MGTVLTIPLYKLLCNAATYGLSPIESVITKELLYNGLSVDTFVHLVCATPLVDNVPLLCIYSRLSEVHDTFAPCIGNKCLAVEYVTTV